MNFASLHAGQSALQSRNADFPANNDIFPTKKICRVALGTVEWKWTNHRIRLSHGINHTSFIIYVRLPVAQKNGYAL